MADPIRFDPARAGDDGRGRVGWRGPWPTTPCSSCGGEWFTWIGDWGMGYRCADCGLWWRPGQ